MRQLLVVSLASLTLTIPRNLVFWGLDRLKSWGISGGSGWILESVYRISIEEKVFPR